LNEFVQCGDKTKSCGTNLNIKNKLEKEKKYLSQKKIKMLLEDVFGSIQEVSMSSAIKDTFFDFTMFSIQEINCIIFTRHFNQIIL
jgi:hypothetical protein